MEMTRDSKPDRHDDAVQTAVEGEEEEESEETTEQREREVPYEPGITLIGDDIKPTISLEDHEVIDDSVRMYLREIGQVPLLTAAQERQLSGNIERRRHLAKLEDAYFKKYRTQLPAVDLTADLIVRLVRAYHILEIIREHLELEDGSSFGELLQIAEVRAAIDNEIKPPVVAAVEEQTNRPSPAAEEAIVGLSVNSSVLPPRALELLQQE